MQLKISFIQLLMIMFASMLLAITSLAHAGKGGGGTSGTLDTTFGTGGIVSSPATIQDTVLQTDGKIIAVGYTGMPNANTAITLERYNPNGSLDTTFGSSGRITEDLGSQDDFLNGVAVQSDGKIVTIGRTVIGNNFYPILVRYNPDGTRDATFGSNGLAFSNPADEELVIQPDGKIVGVGLNGIARFNADGTYDSTFGDAGIATNTGVFYGVALQADGKIVAAGYDGAAANIDFHVVRLNLNGTFDSTFGTNGHVYTDFNGGQDIPYGGVEIHTGGQIVATGRAVTSTLEDYALARYTAVGDLDTAFGTGGKVTTDFNRSYDMIWDTALQADGKLVAAGTVCVGKGGRCTNIYFGLARYLSNGLLDTGFGNSGKVVSNISGYPGSVVIQTDGKIVAGGQSSTGNGGFITRYNP